MTQRIKGRLALPSSRKVVDRTGQKWTVHWIAAHQEPTAVNAGFHAPQLGLPSTGSRTWLHEVQRRRG